MTILHLISSVGYYGAENMILTLASALAPLDVRCVVGVFEDSRSVHRELAENAVRMGIQTAAVPCAGRWDRSAVERIAVLLRRLAPDVLHTHGYKADIYGYLAARRCRVPLVATCHNWADPSWRMSVYAMIDRIILRRFNGVAAVSTPVMETLRRAGVNGASCIPNGVDVDRFGGAGSASLGWPGKDRFLRTVGFVGRLVPEKGGDILIRAARLVISAHPRTAFAFVGEGPARAAWESLARQLGIAEHVRFTGSIPDMPRVYREFDILALPSRLEATPLCLLEAMAAGIPVVATRVGGVPDVVLAGVTAALVEPGDAGALSEALLSLIGDRARAETMARQARARVVERFSARTMSEKYRDLYCAVASRHGASRMLVA